MTCPLKKQTLWHIAWIAWSVFLAIAMLLPSDRIPESELLSHDKIVHLVVFMVYSFIISKAFAPVQTQKIRSIKVVRNALIISILGGIALELMQQFIPGRATDIYDLLANTLGAVLGAAVFIIFKNVKS